MTRSGSGTRGLRADGRRAPLREDPLSGEEIEEAILPALSSRARMSYSRGESADGSLKARGLGRFRITLRRERGRAAATVRALPSEPPRLASLRLPSGVEALTRLARGLVLVGGPTGSGKTTTLAALVEEINRRDVHHILTIADPIEYEHPLR